MISNQVNEGHRLRQYGQNERASSTSSTGPKWTSSISDLLVNRSNTIRFNNQAGQSHQTSQHQLLAQHQPQLASHQQIHHQAPQAPQTADGNRLMMKLMNINMHHQNTSSNVSSNGAHTFDHPRLSGSRDDQKRLALDECTNYLQQKTMQQQFPSTSLAISNIINSNRSASSAGVQGPNSGAAQSTSNAAKKFQAFKFNLTLNKNKALNTQKGVEAPSQQTHAFYQPSQDNPLPSNQEQEDNDAMIMNDRHRSKIQGGGVSRGPSQLAMKQHLKQMIKSYEDQPEALAQTHPIESTQKFDHHHETQHIQNEQQLTYDNNYRLAQVVHAQQTASKLAAAVHGSSVSKPLEKKVVEMDERQKIFEEEIIKRVKEIQNYAKTLHMHLKKLQQSQTKKGEELQSAKEQILQLKEMALGKEDINEQSVSEMVENRLKILDGEVTVQIEHLEQKLVKDYDAKINRQSKSSANDLQVMSQSLKDEIMGQIQEELLTNFKAEMLKQVSEKIKEANRGQEKNLNEFRGEFQEKNQYVEDLQVEYKAFQKDMISRSDKLSKSVKDGKEQTDESINSLGEALRLEMENLKKKIVRDVKADIDSKQYVALGDMEESISKLDLSILSIQNQMNQKLQESSSSSKDTGVNSKLQELEEYVNGQLANIDQELQTVTLCSNQQEEKIRSTQEGLLSLKSNQSTSAARFEDRINRLEESIKTESLQNQSIAKDIQSLKQSIQTLTDDPQVDRDQISLLINENIQPQIDNMNETTLELQQQNELFKQQLTQKLMRSELQEIKQDIDDEIKSLEKVLKKHDERSLNIECSLSSMKQQIESADAKNEMSQDKLREEIENSNAKIDQLSEDIQSKTGDIYEEVQDIQSSVSELQKQKETNYEAPQNQDSVAKLQLKLESHIAEINNRFLEKRNQNQDQEGVDEKIEAVKQDLIELIQQQKGDNFDKTIESKLNVQKEQVDELLDEAITKINELDGRISQLEEKETTVLIEEDKTTLNIEHYEALQNSISDLRTEMESRIKSSIQPFESYVEQFEEINSALKENKEISQNFEVSCRESFENVNQDLKSMRELYVCLQDVMITEEQFSSFKIETGKSVEDRLNELKLENLKLSSDVEGLQQSLSDELERVKSDIEKERSGSEKISETLGELSERIDSLEQSRENEVQPPQIVSARRNVQEIEIEEPVYHNQRQLQVQSNPVGTSRSQQNNINFLTTPRANEGLSPEQEQRQLDTQYQGHFLENLSEVVSSPNNIGNHTNNDGDMMMFNRQSIGGSSIMSNRLMTPIEQRNLFQFNSQVTGQRLIMGAQDNAGSSVFDQEEERKSQHDSVNIASSPSKKSHKTPSSVLHESPSLSQNLLIAEPVIEYNDEDEQLAIQQMNISLESAREVLDSEEITQDRNVFSPMVQETVQVERTSIYQESDQHEDGQSDYSGVQDGQPLQFNVEERFGDEDVESNPNVEEVLQDLINISGDHHDRNQDLIEEEELNTTPRVSHYSQMAEEDQEDSQQPQILLLSPTNIHSQQQLHHHNPHAHQNNHFVAFESDEEDSQQYDLVPISHSRGGSNSALPQQQPEVPAENASQSSNQNRYYESGSGGEDNNEDPEEQQQDNLGQEFDDIEVESAGIQLRQYLQENDDEDEVEEAKDDADYDDSPIENHHSNHRFDIRHEEVNRRVSNHSQLAAAAVPEERQIENDNDEEFQEIQHETLSSHRDSEFSAPHSRRSGSLNIDHNHDNIDENGEDQDEESVVGPQYPEIDLDDSRENMLSEIVAEDEGRVMVIDNDDWNLDEIEEEEKQVDVDKQDLSEKAEVLTAQIVQDEILNSIISALGLKNRFSQKKEQFSLW